MAAILLAGLPVVRAVGATPGSSAPPASFHLDIPREALNTALNDLAIQTRTQIVRFTDAAASANVVGPVSGTYTLAESLSRLLANTGLTFRQINSNTIAIVVAARPPSAAAAEVPPPATMNEGAPISPAEPAGRAPAEERPPQPRRSFFSRLAAIFGVCTAAALHNPACAQEQAAAATEPQPQLEEVVVTGTSIRGVAPTGSELVTVSRDDIDLTAATTSTELLRSLPQMNNFTSTGGNIGANQAGFVDQPAIHGIGVGNGGAGLTLVLFDGNRLPGAGVNQAAPDAGVIPTSALQRVEVLADGGSSVYGSDAVAGVINFIPRKDFNGAETTARVGFADGYNTENFSQLFGRTWDTGSLLLDYEYSGNTHLSGNDRSYAVDDQVPFGGPDTRSNICSPANVTANNTTYALSATGTPVAGATNLCEANRAGDLYPAQYRNQVYGSLHQDVTDTVDLFGSLLFSDREMSDRVAGTELTTGGLSVTVPSTSPYYIPLAGIPAGTPESVTYNPSSDFGPYFTNQIHTQTLSVILGTNFKLGDAWHGEFILNDGIERDDVREFGINQTAATDAAAAGTFNPYGVGAANNAGVLQSIGNFETRYYVRQTLKDGQLKFDGPLFNIPGGPIKAAVGVEVRQEVFDGVTSSGPEGTSGLPTAGLGSTPLVIADSSRNIDSAYAELRLPIVGDANSLPGVRRLDVSLAARYDHYSDFGSTTNPKVGFTWKVIDDLSIRGSAGSSFHAPSLADSPTAIDTRAIQFPCSPGFIGCAGAAPGAYGVVLAGGNKLKPETADTYNLGLDWMPKFLEGLALNLTYFRVDYKDVITFPTFAPVTNPLAAYDAYRTVRPAGITDAQWEAIIDPILSKFRDQGLIWPTNPILPVAIYDLRRQNFANELINGLDYGVNYRFDNDLGKWVAGVAGTQFLTFYQQIPGVSQVVQLLDTDYAVRTKLRGTIGWNKGEYGANVFLNYVGHYTNENFTPYQAVSSFTTVDLHLTWTPALSGILEHTQFTFDVTNLFDRDPPVYYTNNSNNGIPGFDPLAANAFGRILAVGFHKSW